MKRYLTPRCCKKAVRYCSVFLATPDDFYDGSLNGKPKWVTRSWHPKFESVVTRKASFCPHCGKKVPQVERRPGSEGMKIAKVSDGGYYCDTCKERLNGCRCHSPAFHWRLKSDG